MVPSGYDKRKNIYETPLCRLCKMSARDLLFSSSEIDDIAEDPFTDE